MLLAATVEINGEAFMQGRGREGYFARLSQYGKCVAEKQVLTGDSDLFDGLELHRDMGCRTG